MKNKDLDKQSTKFDLYKKINADSEPFKALFELYKGKVYNLALSILKNKEDSEDVLVEVFASLHLIQDKFDEIDNLDAYIFTVTKHKSFNALKKKKSHFEKFKSFEKEDMLNYLHNSIEVDLHFKETNAIIISIIDKLPKQQKVIFELIKLQGFKRKDVAEQLNLSENTIRNHLNAAMKIVKDEFSRKYTLFLPILFWLFQK